MSTVSFPFNIRPFSPNDLDAILEIQSACESTAVWSSRDYVQLADDPMGMILVACYEVCASPRVVGFSAFHRVESEAELQNIAVNPGYRRQGIAKALIEDGCRRLYTAGVRKLFLEVRVSNLPALELYRKFGFAPQARRKEYYRHPTEDALVLACRILPSDG
jgi:ribosomal-protein-alanine N-acetyltransferase